jgi:uroporphyrinogen-III synthase
MGTMRVLITRPLEDAEPLAELLLARGIEAAIEPLMSIEPVDVDLPPLDPVRALLMTSANGVRAFAARSERRDLALFAVGPATAKAARDAGFSTVETADGDVIALADLVERRIKPEEGRLLHIAGTTVAGDLAGRLGETGYSVERLALYNSAAARELSAETVRGLSAGAISHVLLFSPRTAGIFARLARQAGLEPALSQVTALCLSAAVAAQADLDFAAIRIAPRPDQEALLSLLDTPPAPTRRPRRGRWLLASLAILLFAGLAVAGIAYKRGLFEPYGLAAVPQPAPEPDAATLLAERVEQLERDLASLRQRPAEAAPQPDLSALEQRVAGLERKLAELPAAGGPAFDSSKLDAVADRTDHLANEVSGIEARIAQGQAAAQASAAAAGQRAAFALAVAQLSEAIDRGEPFAPSLHAVEGLADAETRKLLEPLAADAERGLPTIDTLYRQFPSLARDAKAAATAGDQTGWVGSVRRFFASLIVIRRTDQEPGFDDVDGKLALAEAKLASHDLAAALAALDGLPKPAAAVLAGWLDIAGRHVAAEQLIRQLDAKAFGALTQGAG